jgi:hypothetical protein
MPKPALLLVGLMAATGSATAAERSATITRNAFLCVSWAAWHEYGQASLTPKGARMSKLCPRRLSAGTKVVLVEDDAGEGSSRIRYRGKEWFVDNQRLR